MRELAAVVSYPRSGTHLTIDFLRRNFVPFSWRPMPWESSERLYYNLDIRDPDDCGEGHSTSEGGCVRDHDDHDRALGRDNLVVKTHDLPLAPRLSEKLTTIAQGRRVTLLYPFRRFSKTLRSYYAHRGADGPPADFAAEQDLFMGQAQSIADTMLAHGDWALEHCVPIDIDDLLRRPSAYVAALSDRFGWDVIERASPLPPKRLAPGRMGELLERFRGRQSSEVVVERTAPPPAEFAYIDQSSAHAALHESLSKAALRPAE